MVFGVFRVWRHGGAQRNLTIRQKLFGGVSPRHKPDLMQATRFGASSGESGEQASGAAERGKGALILKDRAARPYARRDTAKKAFLPASPRPAAETQRTERPQPT